MFYAVNLLYQSERSDLKEGLWEERIILVLALDEDEAKSKAFAFAKDQETQITLEDSEQVSWKFSQIERVFLIDDPLVDGTELFSRFLRGSEVESILTPFDD